MAAIPRLAQHSPHRTRFASFLIEHYAGNFPLWLAPEQVRVLTLGPEGEAEGRRDGEHPRDDQRAVGIIRPYTGRFA